MRILEVVGLTKRFGGRIALDAVSFTAEEGQILALFGPRGAGKTTCGHCLSGVIPPDTGRIIFDGREMTGGDRHDLARAGLARTFQVAKVFPRLTAADNVAVGLGRHRFARLADDAARVAPRVQAPAGARHPHPGRPRRCRRPTGGSPAARDAEAPRDRPRARGPAAAHPARRAVRRALRCRDRRDDRADRDACAARGSPSSSSSTGWMRRWAWPTGRSSSTAASSSRRARPSACGATRR